MKTFGKIILGLIIVFIGITIFNYTNGVAVHKSVAEQGDAAYLNDDLSFFKNRFEYHKDTPLLEENITFEISDEYLENNGLEDIIDRTVSLKLYVFHSANVSKEQGNYLTVLVKDLTLPEEIKTEEILDVYFKHDIFKPREGESFSLVKVGKENWYLQWIKLTVDNILSFTIKHKNLVLYEYSGLEPFLRSEDYDLVEIVNKNNYMHNVVTKISEDIKDIETDFLRNYLAAEVTNYELDFIIHLDPSLKYKGDLYLSGEFNNWAIGDQRYKLVRKGDFFTTKINYDSGYKEVYYTITTKEGRVALEKNGDIKYFVHTFIIQDNDLSDYDIIKSSPISFNKYSYYKWAAMGAYIGVLVIISTIIVLVTIFKNKKLGQNKLKKDNIEEKEIVDANNTNNSKIESIEE